MSDDASNPPIVDLSSLRLMPDWVSNFGNEPKSKQPQYRDESERPDRGQRGDRRSGGPGRPGDRGAPRRDERRGPPGGHGGQGGGPRRDRDERGGGGGGGYRGRQQRDERPRFERPEIPLGVQVVIEGEERAIDALVQHIKHQSTTFGVFDVARLLLAGTDRHVVRFDCEASRLVGLYHPEGTNALFETKEEAVRYLLKDPAALNLYYSTEEVELEEPKGNFNSIAVCGKTGTLLGPPSHHSYQTTLKRIHTERFADMPFEEYKRWVEVKAEPELVEKWKAEQRKGTKWTWLKAADGQEPVSFTSASEVEAHFRRTHGEAAVVEVRSATLRGDVRREQLSPGLGRLFRRTLEDTRKHLFDLAQRTAQALDKRGLKLFKRRGGKLFVCRVRPKALAADVVVSDRIAAIMECVKAEPGILLAALVEKLSPSEPTTAEAATPRELTDEQKLVVRDVRWLTGEGYVLEYTDGPLFLGIQGSPATPGDKKEPQAKVAETHPAESNTATDIAPEEDSSEADATEAEAQEVVPMASEAAESSVATEDEARDESPALPAETSAPVETSPEAADDSVGSSEA